MYSRKIVIHYSPDIVNEPMIISLDAAVKTIKTALEDLGVTSQLLPIHGILDTTLLLGNNRIVVTTHVVRLKVPKKL